MNQKLNCVVSGIFLGVLVRSFLNLGFAVAGLLILFAVAFSWRREFLVALLCLGAAAGYARYEWKDTSHSVAAPTELRGIVSDEPDVRESEVQYRITLGNNTKLLLHMPLDGRLEYGDVVLIAGKIARTDQSYLTKDEIYFEITNPKVEILAYARGSWLRAKLFDLKRAFLERLARMIPEPEASLAGGLDVGAKQSLGKALLDKFRTAGLIHMVVLSGYNISILAVGVMWLLKRRFSERVSIGVGVVVILLFAIMTGGGATVFRATVMALIALWAKGLGRESEAGRALVIAGLLMVAVNPKVLVFDIGFQLSFLATLGLIYIEPLLRPHFTWLPEKVASLKFREVASSTLAAQVAVLPLILYTFGNFSPYAFPANMLVLPLVPLTMLFVFLAGFIGLFLIPLALPFAWVAYVLLAYMVSLVILVSKLPLANLQISHIPLAIPLILYAIEISWVWSNYQYTVSNKTSAGPALPPGST